MKKLYIGNLSYQSTTEAVASFLAQALPEGTNAADVIVKVELIPGIDGNPNKGFGFAEIADEAVANMLIDQLNGQELDGRPLIVNEARPKTDRPQRSFDGGSRGGYNGSRGGYDGGNRRSQY